MIGHTPTFVITNTHKMEKQKSAGPRDPEIKKVFEHHDWAQLVTAGDRRKFGKARIRKCRQCGLIEVYDTVYLRREYIALSLRLRSASPCDPWHRELAGEVGLKYLPYKLAGDFTEEEFKEAELPVPTAEPVEASEGGQP